MPVQGLSVVTGAFSYTGKHIARLLLAQGHRVRTLTGHPNRPSPFGDKVEVAALDFDDPDGLARSLDGADVLYNTYWVRFPRGRTTFERAVRNSEVLIKAAERSGVGRILQISHVNAWTGSPLPYFRGKGLVEEAVTAAAISHAIVRPALIFGPDDILVNNIAWALRRLPFFPILGRGDYRVRPVYVGDVADLAVSAAQGSDGQVFDAVGPEVYTYEEMVRLIERSVRGRARLVHLPPRMGIALTALVGYAVRDVVLTRQEAEGLMAGLVSSEGPATGATLFSAWLDENGDALGRRYTSELRRNYRRP